MKTVKMSLVNIQGKLSRTEMKKVVGGVGTCCAHNSDWSAYTCGLSKAQAQDNVYDGPFSNWCCDSCPSQSA